MRPRLPRLIRNDGGFSAAVNDSRSVGPFFPRKHAFIRAISASLTRQIVTSAPSRPSSSQTWRRNNSSGRRVRRAVLWRLRIILAEFLLSDPSPVVFPILFPGPWPFHSLPPRASAHTPLQTLRTRG